MASDDMIQKVLTIVVIPILLLIGLIVYGNFDDATMSTFEVEYANESHTGLAAAPVNVTLDHPPLVDGTLTVYNDSAHSTTFTEGTDYTVFGDDTVQVETEPGGDVYFAYTGHGGDGYTTSQTVNSNTYNGFDLAAVLPVVIAGVAVLTLVIGAFVGLGS